MRLLKKQKERALISTYQRPRTCQASNDYGIDILAKRKNTSYAIQCKRYSGNVGNKAVQETGLGMDFYHCDAAAVITNTIVHTQNKP